MSLNGREPLQVQTLHGAFDFQKQRLVLADGTQSDYLQQTNQQAVSAGLQEMGLYYVNRLSFHEVEGLVERVCGVRLACEQTLWNWAQRKVEILDARLVQQVRASEELPSPAVAEMLDLYDAAAEEVLVFTDAIGVKAQKPLRDKPGELPTKKEAKRHDTDVLLLEKPDGDFLYRMGSTDHAVSLVQVAQAGVRREWGQRETPLPVVALTDGARKIRSDLLALFGEKVTIILDGYHLHKRVYQHLSMSAHSKRERESWEHTLLGYLWHGQVAETLSFLGGLSPRNAEALAELVGYLQKHTCEIIDYERRSATGKSVGSGRMEKAVDQVIGMRQKKKGMSWSEQGSQTLAQLKIAELNGQWEQLFAA